MRVLTLDLGLSVGWACGEEEKIPSCGSTRVVGDDLGSFNCSFMDWLARKLTEVEPSEIAIEGGSPIQVFKNAEYALKMANMLGLTLMLAKRRKYPTPKLHHVNTVRAFVVGTGHAKDPLIMRAMVELGCLPKDSHAADAAAVWFFHHGRKWRPARAAA